MFLCVWEKNHCQQKQTTLSKPLKKFFSANACPCIE